MSLPATPRWHQFSLGRLLIVMGLAPPLLAGGFFLVKDLGLEALVVVCLLLWPILIIDLLRNPAISMKGKIVWFLMMAFSCPVGTLLYVVVRLHGWVAGNVAASQIDLPNS